MESLFLVRNCRETVWRVLSLKFLKPVNYSELDYKDIHILF